MFQIHKAIFTRLIRYPYVTKLNLTYLHEKWQFSERRKKAMPIVQPIKTVFYSRICMTDISDNFFYIYDPALNDIVSSIMQN